MLLLDTNVLSALMAATPPEAVAARMARQPMEQSYAAAAVTRDIADFAHCGVAVINPWDRSV